MDRAYFVWLLMVMGPHNVKSVELYLKYKDITKIYEIINSDKYELTASEKKRKNKYKLSDAERVVAWCDKNEIKIITLADNEYPVRLSSTYNPPILLFCLGDLSFVDDEVTVGIVGTRRPSEYSVNVAAQICYNLARLGVVTVSGFAVGIDSVAHGCSLREREKTIAVLGCGIDISYPKENAKLKKVIAKSGAVITEFLPGTPPLKENFPERNRIISGLSCGVLIVEADSKSGSLITAEHALQQGREVFCVPPASIFDRRYNGVIKLLRDGAIPVFSHLDIVYTYFDELNEKINPDNPYADYSLDLENKLATNSKEAEIKTEKENKKSKQKQIEKQEDKENKTKESIELDMDLFDDIQRKIIEMLLEKECIADELAKKSGLKIDEVLSALTELEILGTIRISEGQRYKIV